MKRGKAEAARARERDRRCLRRAVLGEGVSVAESVVRVRRRRRSEQILPRAPEAGVQQLPLPLSSRRAQSRTRRKTGEDFQGVDDTRCTGVTQLLDLRHPISSHSSLPTAQHSPRSYFFGNESAHTGVSLSADACNPISSAILLPRNPTHVQRAERLVLVPRRLLRRSAVVHFTLEVGREGVVELLLGRSGHCGR
mgnify:FL=1